MYLANNFLSVSVSDSVIDTMLVALLLYVLTLLFLTGIIIY